MLAIELLAIKIRDVQNIKGIRNWSLNNVLYIEDIIKIAFYADDITFFLKMTCGMLLMSFTSSLSFLA